MSYSRKGKRGNKDMKVIFLDVDGVLNSQQLFEKSEDAQLISVDEENIKNLKKIVDAQEPRSFYHLPGDMDGQNTVMQYRTGARSWLIF